MTDPIYFASGSNLAGELRGFDDIGHPVGVTLARLRRSGDSFKWTNRILNAAAWNEIARLHGLLFMDSGAFCEVDGETLEIVAPISDSDWLERLAQYRAAALMLGGRLHVVAPDCVAHQELTLERLDRYQGHVRELIKLGANVLVALQGGALNPIDFYVRCLRVLGVPRHAVIPAFPMAKARGAEEALLNFIYAVQPRAIHLLGVRPSQVEGLIARAAALKPLQISTDSCALNGGANGKQPVNYDWSKCSSKTWSKPGGLRRRKTGKVVAALIEAADELAQGMWAEGPQTCMGDHPGDWTDEIASPSAWASKSLLLKIAGWMALNKEETAAFLRDPDQWLQEDDGEEPRYLDPLVEAALDRAWKHHYWKATTQERKRRGVVRAFNKEDGR